MATTLEQLAPPIEQIDITGGPPRKPPEKPTGKRLMSLDAYRGFIMIVLAANGFGWHALIKSQHRAFAVIAGQFDHVPWTGMVFWDLIQPAFMFMVGVAMPFALSSRRNRGATNMDLFRHVAWRALMLVVWSQVIMSISRGQLGFQLMNVLAQIAFTYFFCYFLMQLRFRWQAVAAVLILAFYSALFYLFPGPDGAFSQEANVGAIIDHFVGLHNRGLYTTINFIPSTVTTLFGVWIGMLMMRHDTDSHRMKVLALGAAGCFLTGWALSPLVPMVKRIWTASFTLFSAGWVLLMLLAFYWLVEVRGFRKLAFPLVVVGMNSIFIYTLSIVLSRWLDRAVGVFTYRYWFLGELAPVAQACTVVLVMWYFCYWLYQRKIFFKF